MGDNLFYINLLIRSAKEPKREEENIFLPAHDLYHKINVLVHVRSLQYPFPSVYLICMSNTKCLGFNYKGCTGYC